jgi:hypothetical protein
MTITVLGQLVAPAGRAIHYDTLGAPVSVSFTEPLAYQRHQPADLPVYFDHDASWRLGRVTYLERSQRHGLVAAAELDADIGDLLAEHGPWYWSDRVVSRRASQTLQRSDAQLRELSLVRSTANCGTKPVASAPSNAGPPRTLPSWMHDTWRRAAEAISAARYRRADSTDIFDVDPLDIPDEWKTDRSAAQARLRAAMPKPMPVDTERVYRHNVGGYLRLTD